MPQRDPFKTFHRDERMPILLADIVDCANVGMVQCGRSLRLSLKTRQRVRIACESRWEKFQRDESLEARVFCFVDHAHSASADLLDDAVVRDSAADRRLRIWHVALS